MFSRSIRFALIGFVLCLVFASARSSESPAGPSITVQPAGQSVDEGAAVQLSVGATGTPPVSFQWLKNGAPIMQAIRPTLVLDRARAMDAGLYSVLVTDRNGRTYSASAPIVVRATASIASTPAAKTSVNSASPSWTFSTLAGRVTSGSVDGVGSAARFDGPVDVAVDSSGNIFVADSSNHTIRQISAAGVVTTLAGTPGVFDSVDGMGSSARFHRPCGLAVDGAGNLYVADTWNHTIRKITLAGVVTTLAGSPGSSGAVDGSGNLARFNFPRGIAVDGSGANLYVADQFNHTIRRIVTATGVVSTLAGLAAQLGGADGTASAAHSLTLAISPSVARGTSTSPTKAIPPSA